MPCPDCNNSDDVTVRQAQQTGDYLLPKIELLLNTKLDPVVGRLESLETWRRNLGRGWKVLVMFLSFLGSLTGLAKAKGAN
jgi:hypothetical protein